MDATGRHVCRAHLNRARARARSSSPDKASHLLHAVFDAGGRAPQPRGHRPWPAAAGANRASPEQFDALHRAHPPLLRLRRLRSLRRTWSRSARRRPPRSFVMRPLSSTVTSNTEAPSRTAAAKQASSRNFFIASCDASATNTKNSIRLPFRASPPGRCASCVVEGRRARDDLSLHNILFKTLARLTVSTFCMQ